MIDHKATVGKATKTDSKCHTNDSDKPVSGVARNDQTYRPCYTPCMRERDGGREGERGIGWRDGGREGGREVYLGR